MQARSRHWSGRPGWPDFGHGWQRAGSPPPTRRPPGRHRARCSRTPSTGGQSSAPHGRASPSSRCRCGGNEHLAHESIEQASESALPWIQGRAVPPSAVEVLVPAVPRFRRTEPNGPVTPAPEPIPVLGDHPVARWSHHRGAGRRGRLDADRGGGHLDRPVGRRADRLGRGDGRATAGPAAEGRRCRGPGAAFQRAASALVKLRMRLAHQAPPL